MARGESATPPSDLNNCEKEWDAGQALFQQQLEMLIPIPNIKWPQVDPNHDSSSTQCSLYMGNLISTCSVYVIGKAVEENIQQAQVWMKAFDAGIDVPLPNLPPPPPSFRSIATSSPTQAPGPVYGPVLPPRLARERLEAVPPEKYLLIDHLHDVVTFETLATAIEEAVRRIRDRAQGENPLS